MFELLYHPEAFAEIKALSPKMRAKALNALDKLETLGSELRFPHTRAMGNGLFELRAGNKDISRTFFRPYEETTNILYDHWACAPSVADMLTFFSGVPSALWARRQSPGRGRGGGAPHIQPHSQKVTG